MYVAEIAFSRPPRLGLNEASQAIHSVLAALLHNGQILSSGYGIAVTPRAFRVTVLIPERSALQARNHGGGVPSALACLAKTGLARMRVRILGREIEGDEVDSCEAPSAMVLGTNFLTQETPLRCLEHFRRIPLYRFSAVRGELAAAIGYWSAVYKACDALWISSGPGERWSGGQLAHPGSSLGRAGRRLCRVLELRTGIPTYYYLQRGILEHSVRPGADRCPACGQPWRVRKRVLARFAYRCDPCRLLSNPPGE